MPLVVGGRDRFHNQRAQPAIRRRSAPALAFGPAGFWIDLRLILLDRREHLAVRHAGAALRPRSASVLPGPLGLRRLPRDRRAGLPGGRIAARPAARERDRDGDEPVALNDRNQASDRE